MDHCPSCHEELPRSTDGSVETLQKRIIFLENELLRAALAQPRCSEKAFQTYVEGVVSEAVSQERTRFTQMYHELRSKDAAIIRKLHSENQMLEAALQNIGLVHPPPLENDPAYAKFIKLSTRARAGRIHQ